MSNAQNNTFTLVSDYQPTRDQPQAIEKLVKGFKEGNQCQTLLGVTGSGKTFTMANIISAPARRARRARAALSTQFRTIRYADCFILS